LELVFACSHFSQCYGLNRFLVLLLGRYLELYHPSKKNPLRPGLQVQRVTGISPHFCTNRPAVCHGESHEVVFVKILDCRQSTTAGPTEEPYHVVILRHGVAPPSPVFGATRISPPRQIVPYHVTT